MGKHDSKRFNWDEVPVESFSEAEVKKLRTENETLRNTVKALERDLARMDRVYDRASDSAHDVIAEKDAYIGKLERAFLREVTR